MNALPASTAQNPYAPSSDPVPAGMACAAPSLFRWRLYLVLHLVAVLATAAMMIASRADYYHSSQLHDFIVPVGHYFEAFAMLGIPLACASPMVIIVLLVRAGLFGPRYAVAALVETILMAAHFYALLPLVQ